MFLLLSYCRRYKAECLNPNEWFFMTSVTIHWATVDMQCKATIRRSYLQSTTQMNPLIKSTL